VHTFEGLPKIETDNKNSIMLRGDVEPTKDALELERLKDAVNRRSASLASLIVDHAPESKVSTAHKTCPFLKIFPVLISRDGRGVWSDLLAEPAAPQEGEGGNPWAVWGPVTASGLRTQNLEIKKKKAHSGVGGLPNGKSIAEGNRAGKRQRRACSISLDSLTH
jgi:hypothetical protein